MFFCKTCNEILHEIQFMENMDGNASKCNNANRVVYLKYFCNHKNSHDANSNSR